MKVKVNTLILSCIGPPPVQIKRVDYCHDSYCMRCTQSHRKSYKSLVASNGAVALLAFSKVLAYPFKIAENIKALDCAARQLLALEKDVIAIRNILQIHESHRKHQVDEWLRQVHDVQEKVEEINENYKQTKTIRIWNNFNISRDAAKKLVEVEDLRHNEIIKEIMINYTSHHEMPASPQRPGVEINYERTRSHARFGFAFHLQKN